MWIKVNRDSFATNEDWETVCEEVGANPNTTLSIKLYIEKTDIEEKEEKPMPKITQKRIKELRKLFRSLARGARDCDELESYLDGCFSCGDFTDAEYDIIKEHWDEWLPK